MNVNNLSQYDIVLHIGLPKTGSSAIQKFCLDNQDWLAKQGVLYPKHGMDKNGVSGGHDYFYKTIHNNELSLTTEYIEETIKTAKKKKQVVLLSSEGSHIYSQRVQEVLTPYKVLVIAFFRHPFEKLFSAFNQTVKRHFVKQALDDYVEKSLNEDKPILEGRTLFEYKARFSNFIVRPYQTQLSGPGSVVYEIFKVLGLDTEYVESHNKVGRVNSGYCTSALELKRLLNNVLPPDDKKLNSKLDLELQAISDSGRYSDIPLRNSLSADTLSNLKKKFEPVVENINKTFGITLPNLSETQSTFSSLNLLSEMIAIVQHLKQNRSRLYNILRQKIVEHNWSDVGPDQLKLSELFDHTIEYRYKAKQDFYHPNVVRGMPQFTDVDFFRENAKLFWYRGDVETAFKLIDKALELRNGPVIRKLHEQIKNDYLKQNAS
jgi:hypothetical protein